MSSVRNQLLPLARVLWAQGRVKEAHPANNHGKNGNLSSLFLSVLSSFPCNLHTSVIVITRLKV